MKTTKRSKSPGGLRVVMYGGSPRAGRREAIRREFKFAELDWPQSHKVRILESLARSIAQKKIDLVLILQQHVNHRETVVIVAAARSSGTPWAMVPNGYGIDSIRGAIERYAPEMMKLNAHIPRKKVQDSTPARLGKASDNVSSEASLIAGTFGCNASKYRFSRRACHRSHFLKNFSTEKIFKKYSTVSPTLTFLVGGQGFFLGEFGEKKGGLASIFFLGPG